MKKMNKNFIIGKKQIVLSALVLLLSGAVYINYVYSNQDEKYLQTQNPIMGQTQNDPAMDVNHDKKENENETKTDKNYGDAQLVSGQTTGVTEYFQKVALEKTRSRDEAIETVKTVLKDTKVSEEKLQEASAKIAKLTQQIEDESKIESLIKAKGFSECVVYLDDQSANVVVKTQGLEAEQVAQIKNIVVAQKNIKSENISIQEVE